MNNIKPYTKYKPSGIEWLGDIPEHWEVRRIKHLGKAIIGIIYNPKDLCDENDGILVLRSSNVQNEKIDYRDCVYVNQNIRETQLTQKGDILICSRNGSINLIGKNALIEGKAVGKTFGAFMTIFRGNHNEYVSYFLKSPQFKAQMGLCFTSTINQLTSGVLYNLFLALPKAKSEQTAIANFLDYKLSKIDRFIKKKKQLIKLLNEQKAGIINAAVTKGIDPKVKTKPSGIEWLGDIPEHWEVVKLRFLVKMTTGNKNTEDKVENGEFDFYVRSQKVAKINSYTFDGEGILTAGDGVGVGKVFHYVNGKFDYHQRVYLFYGFSNIIDAKFLFMFLKTYLKIDLMLYNSKSTVDSVRMPILKNFSVFVPPLPEQQQIVTHIETETAKLNQAITTIEKEIILVQEYRTALIAEAVTGKIDVREYAIPEMNAAATDAMGEDENEWEEELSMAAEDAEAYESGQNPD